MSDGRCIPYAGNGLQKSNGEEGELPAETGRAGNENAGTLEELIEFERTISHVRDVHERFRHEYEGQKLPKAVVKVGFET